MQTSSTKALMEQARKAAEAPQSLYRVFWLFVLAGFLGDLIETVFWLITRGQITNRSSLIVGPFSVVWGLGAVLLTLLIQPLAGRGASTIFAAGTLFGGGFEYLCSWIQEKVFGVWFWYYGHLPFNLNARINLVFCFFWGFAAVVWIRSIYPLFCYFIETRLRPRARHLTVFMAVFMSLSILLSAAALGRMEQRHNGVPATSQVSVWLDKNFPDTWLSQHYPSMHFPEYYGH